MTQIQGLKNFSINIKDTIGKKLLPDERHSIVQFYLEVLDYLNEHDDTDHVHEAIRRFMKL